LRAEKRRHSSRILSIMNCVDGCCLDLAGDADSGSSQGPSKTLRGTSGGKWRCGRHAPSDTRPAPRRGPGGAKWHRDAGPQNASVSGTDLDARKAAALRSKAPLLLELRVLLRLIFRSTILSSLDVGWHSQQSSQNSSAVSLPDPH
jgi:hypothetical protein